MDDNDLTGDERIGPKSLAKSPIDIVGSKNKITEQAKQVHGFN